MLREFGQCLLQEVRAPSDKVLGAIVFLANQASEIGHLVSLANSDPEAQFNAATVKDERAR